MPTARDKVVRIGSVAQLMRGFPKSDAEAAEILGRIEAIVGEPTEQPAAQPKEKPPAGGEEKVGKGRKRGGVDRMTPPSESSSEE